MSNMLNMISFLEVHHEKAGWIKDAIRSVFWGLAEGVLLLLDGMFTVINDIWQFKFFNNKYVNTIYSSAIIIACTWLILKVIIEIVMHHIVRQDENSSPTSVFKGIIIAITMMFLIPPLFNWGYKLSSKMTKYVVAVSTDGTSESSFESSMSTMILSAFSNDDKMDEDDKKYFVKNWMTTDYNATKDKGIISKGVYKYSFSTFPIFLTGLVVVVLLFFVGIQVAKRVIELALYKSIAPFVCTSLITNRSHTFEVWLKGVIGAFITTTVQYLCIGIMFNVFGSVVKGTDHVLSVILVIIGALLFIISSPQIITQLLNTNTGIMSNMGSLPSMLSSFTSMMVMSKMSKYSDSSSSSSTNNNSTDGGTSGTSPPSEASGPDISSSMNQYNTESQSQMNNDSGLNNSNGYNNQGYGSDLSYNINSNGINDNYNFEDITSISDRIEVYKDMTDTNFNVDNEVDYLSNMNWGDIDVSNTEKY